MLGGRRRNTSSVTPLLPLACHLPLKGKAMPSGKADYLGGRRRLLGKAFIFGGFVILYFRKKFAFPEENM
ncbi:MAG: hypothetical protein IJE28_03870, partial [Oscillospiraceae bacterium]|nr:hypothetical protein [Oscillospiraceae bacterium]